MSRSVADRIKRRRLPNVDAPKVGDDSLRLWAEGIKEHLRMYEGDSGAPKERFVTLEELEASGLIGLEIKQKFATISEVGGSPVPTVKSKGSVVPPTAPVLGITTLAGLDDTSIAGVSGSQYLKFDGIDWVNVDLTITESQITDLQDYLVNVVEDSTPQLGGSLDTNGSDINWEDGNWATFGTGADVTLQWDGSQFGVSGVAGGQGFHIYDGMDVRIYDSSDTDYMSMQHDSTDFNFAYVNTTAVNFSGATAYNFDTEITAATINGLLTTDRVDMDHLLVGAALDSPAITVASNGTVITLSMEKSGTGDVRVFFTSGVVTVDCTPAATQALTAGTDTSPQINFVYVLESTGLLAASTSSWPSAEHAPVATVLCQSAASAQTDGLYKVHAWTDHAHNDETGHLAHLNFWIRSRPAGWVSGALATATAGAAQFDVAVSSGTVLQLHEHAWPSFDTATGSEVMVVNDSVTPFVRSGDLTGITLDSAGGSLTNKYFNVVIWGVVSEDSGDCQLMVNLPTSSYTNSAAAQLDADGTAVYDIPANYSGVGFLISRLTMRYQAGGGGTYTEQLNTDLRGSFPSTSAGGSGGGGGVSELIELTDVDTAADTANFFLATPDGVTGLYSGRAIVADDLPAEIADLTAAETVSGDWIFTGAGTAPLTNQSKITQQAIWLDGKEAFLGSDSWLRLNNASDFVSGVFTPGLLRADGGLQVNGSTSFSVSGAGALTTNQGATFNANTYVKAGGVFRVYDAGDTDYIYLEHNGTNAYIGGVNTGALVLEFFTGLTATSLTTATLGSYVFDADQTVGVGQDNYVLTYDNALGTIQLEAGFGAPLVLADNEKIEFGTGTDATMYFDAANLIVDGVTDAFNIHFMNFGSHRFYDPGGTDYLYIEHDGTDATIGGVNTTDLILEFFTQVRRDGFLMNPEISEIITANSSATFALTDAGTTWHKATSTAAQTFTIPANASVAFPIGTMIAVKNSGTVTVSIAITTDTLTGTDGATGTRTLAAFQTAVIQKMTATTWEYVATDL